MPSAVPAPSPPPGRWPQWLVDHQPHLAGSAKRAPDPEHIGELPDRPTLPELAAVLGAPPRVAADTVMALLDGRALGPSHRAVLVNFVARVSPPALELLAERLDRADPSAPSIGLAFALADLARLRHRMLSELESR